MKISWGTKVIVSFIIFAAGIVVMVAVSVSKNTDLVSDNYYEQEVKYQGRIDAMKNAVRDSSKLAIEEVQDAVILRKNISDGSADNFSGDVHLYRPSDAKKDFTKTLEFDASGVMKIYKSGMAKGAWKVQVSYSDGSKQYYTEKNIFIN